MKMTRWALFAALLVLGAFVGALLSKEIGRQLAVLAVSPFILAAGFAMEAAIERRDRHHGAG